MKKKIKVIILLPIILINMVLLSSCWNYREIERLAIVAGVAIDKGRNTDSFLITVEIIDLKSAGKETEIKSKKIESEGESIFDAVRNVISVSAKRLYWPHSKVVIISQDIAREGIIKALDWFNRDAEIRPEIKILISKEKTAKELLSLQSVTTEIRSLEMDEMINSQNSLSKAPSVESYKFTNMLRSEGISAVLPAIKATMNEGKETSAISGAAVFKEDRLIGFLDENDTKYLLFVKDEIKGGLLVERELLSNGRSIVTLEILESSTRVKPENNDGKIVMNINMRIEVAIGEYVSGEDYLNEEGIKKLERYYGESLEENIKRVVRMVQEDYGSDVFGFGRVIKADMPSVWRKIAQDWDKEFKNLDVNVNAQINIKNTALASKPIKTGE